MAKPSTSCAVLEKRIEKSRTLLMEEVLSICEVEAAKSDSFKAHFKAAQMHGYAKDVKIARLQRMLVEAKKA